MEPVLLYITAQDKTQATTLARALLEARLIACANIIDGAASLYRWEGRIETAPECVLMMKSTRGRAQAIIDKVTQLHSYACPCVVAVPIVAGNQPFLDWITQETEPSGVGA